eukprot:295397_1
MGNKNESITNTETGTDTIKSLLSMGFDETLCYEAVNKFNNDLSSCVEYIISRVNKNVKSENNTHNVMKTKSTTIIGSDKTKESKVLNSDNDTTIEQKLEYKNAENASEVVNETDEKKVDYNSEDDEYSDIEEVCVSGGDKRLEIYETKHKNDIIVQCIGNLRINYSGVGGGYSIGTGTVFHVDGNKVFIMTCAHNIRMKLYHCTNTNSQCKGKMLYNKPCNRCGHNVIKKPELFKANGVTFIRRGITKQTFGDHENEYDCDMNECFINDNEYKKYPHPKSG